MFKVQILQASGTWFDWRSFKAGSTAYTFSTEREAIRTYRIAHERNICRQPKIRAVKVD